MTANSYPSLRIGSLTLANPLCLAPMAGISDLPFRRLAKAEGCAMVSTEMIPSEGLVRNWKRNEQYLRSVPQERPLTIQLFGSQPETMAEAAARVEAYGADVVDINMGCPVRKIVSRGAGAAILRDLPRLQGIIRAVRQKIRIPLTIKIRSGWDERSQNFIEVGRIAEGSGVDALILHARTRSQSYGTPASWEVIARAKDSLGIPVIGNGDLMTPQAAVECLAKTGCDGVMIGRGALGNPWIFRSTLNLLQGNPPYQPSIEEKERMALRHLQMMVEDRGEARSLREFRKHLIWYTRGLPGGSLFRSQIAGFRTIPEMVARIQEYFYRLKTLAERNGLEPQSLPPKPPAAEPVS